MPISILFDSTSSVAVSFLMATSPEIPVITVSGKLITDALLLSEYWNGIDCGFEGSHFVAPSEVTPVPPRVKVAVLSRMQGCPRGVREKFRSIVPFLS